MEDQEAAHVRKRTSPRVLATILAVTAFGAVAILLAVSRPDGATYAEYLQLKEGMSRQAVATVIGEGDYWHHAEGDLDVTSWVNKDGTYIKAVFDKGDRLVQVSWESGWDPRREKPE